MALKCCPLLVAKLDLVSLEETAYNCGALFYLFPMGRFYFFGGRGILGIWLDLLFTAGRDP